MKANMLDDHKNVIVLFLWHAFGRYEVTT